MKKLDMSKFRINRKRDWVIFWIVAALLAYIVADRYDARIVYWLRGMESPWLGHANEPQNYGRMMIAAVILAVLAEAVCFLRRKSLRVKLTVLAAGVIAPIALTGLYLGHCRLIVSSLWKEEPTMVTIWWKDSQDSDSASAVSYTPNQEEQARLLEYCRNLTIVSDEGLQNEFRQWNRESHAGLLSQDHVDLRFPEKYGHHYSLGLYVWNDHLYIFRGYDWGYDIFITLFEDNGILDYLENLELEHKTLH